MAYGSRPHATWTAFTVGRGTEVQVTGIRALAPPVVGQPVDAVLGDMASFSRSLTGDSQPRWLGPEKGVMQMAAAAVINAAWDRGLPRSFSRRWSG
jgi:L-fuconate dehydratase